MCWRPSSSSASCSPAATVAPARTMAICSAPASSPAAPSSRPAAPIPGPGWMLISPGRATPCGLSTNRRRAPTSPT
ncbi:hypothetical protein SYNGFB01_01220 [Synechococcus sp. GFB01]|nr:hypothetical protein SYNGFB01_01220 [Synechococcus sp. GFB01]